MIIVLGEVRAEKGQRDLMLAQAVAHVNRSIQEPGCLSHGVSLDAQDPDRLLFTERWQDAEALQQHPRQESSRAFAESIRRHGQWPPKLEVFEVRHGRLPS